MIEFTLPQNYQKQLIMQGFDLPANSLSDIVEFWEQLDMAKEIFQ